jgi:uncharacterized protein YjbI with pentapeptide repeats
MTRQARSVKEWTERWRHESFVPGRLSPFGRTETGAHDYRGVSFGNKAITNAEIRDSDFAAADLRHLRVEHCNFIQCNFSGGDLTQLVTTSSRFENCRFDRADLRLAQIGYHGTEFRNCTFDRVKVGRVGYLNPIFTDVCFDGKNWSHTDFRASGFWNCSFIGVLRDITFRGTYLYPLQKEMVGEPRSTGLHNVNFSSAELHWVGFYNGSILENITLPTDGHAFICKTNDIIAASSAFDSAAREYGVLADYLSIIRPDPLNQEKKIISRNDLVKVGGEDIGTALYSRLKLELS